MWQQMWQWKGRLQAWWCCCVAFGREEAAAVRKLSCSRSWPAGRLVVVVVVAVAALLLYTIPHACH